MIETLCAEWVGQETQYAVGEAAEEEANPEGNTVAGGGDAASHRQHEPQNCPNYADALLWVVFFARWYLLGYGRLVGVRDCVSWWGELS